MDSPKQIEERESRLCWGRLLALALACAFLLHADDEGTSPPDEIQSNTESSGIAWKPLIGEALFFNVVQNGFRAGTQDYTQSRLGGRFFHDWGSSINNLHGWGDGDNFMTNYVLHPMQGAINGFIFVQNDRKYRTAVFGKNREYWKSRARAMLFAFVASEALELGPISEASIGNASQYYPQWGLVDHVVTPSIGLVWMIGEDFLDKYIVAGVETRTRNKWVRGIMRSTLNPSRSFANLMAIRAPWYRETRSNQLSAALLSPAHRTAAESFLLDPKTSAGIAKNTILPVDHRTFQTAVPKFELAPSFTYTQMIPMHSGSSGCIGGGANANFNINSWLGISADVGGCNMLSPGKNKSGDSLTYVAGPRFTLRNSSGWIPYFHVFAGGTKLSIETVNPALKPAKTTGIREIDLPAFHESYTSQAQTNSFTLKVGVGLDHVVNDAFAFRVIEIDNVHVWTKALNDRLYRNNVALTTGVIVRFGTW